MSERSAETNQVERLEKRLRQLEAREAIREKLYLYARAVDRCDLDMLKTCYHPEAIDVHWVFVGDAAGFSEYLIPEMEKFRSVRHCITNPVIDFRDNRAFVESQYWCVLRLDFPHHGCGDYIERQSFGRYLDIWEERNGDWRIAHRHLTDDGVSNKLVLDQPMPVFNPARTAQPNRNDPVYKGFSIIDLCPPDFRQDDIAGMILAATANGNEP